MKEVKIVAMVQAGWIANNGLRYYTEFPVETCYLWMLDEMAPAIDPLVKRADRSRNFVNAPSLIFSSQSLAKVFAANAQRLPGRLTQWLRGTTN